MVQGISLFCCVPLSDLEARFEVTSNQNQKQNQINPPHMCSVGLSESSFQDHRYGSTLGCVCKSHSLCLVRRIQGCDSRNLGF